MQLQLRLAQLDRNFDLCNLNFNLDLDFDYDFDLDLDLDFDFDLTSTSTCGSAAVSGGRTPLGASSLRC